MPSGRAHRIDLAGILLLAALSAVAIFLVLVAVPWVARATGVSALIVVSVMCGVCGAIYVAGVIHNARKKVGAK